MEEYQIEMLFERMLSQLSLSVETKITGGGWDHPRIEVSVKLRNQSGREILSTSDNVILP